jgi:hypothetical protein
MSEDHAKRLLLGNCLSGMRLCLSNGTSKQMIKTLKGAQIWRGLTPVMIAHELDRVQISCIALSECMSNPKISSVASSLALIRSGPCLGRRIPDYLGVNRSSSVVWTGLPPWVLG